VIAPPLQESDVESILKQTQENFKKETGYRSPPLPPKLNADSYHILQKPFIGI
jgi:hypothetical protein